MMSTFQSTSPLASRGSGSWLSQLLRIVRQLPLAYRVYSERRALMSLSDQTLKDIGLSRADAYREASRPWWHVPENR